MGKIIQHIMGKIIQDTLMIDELLLLLKGDSRSHVTIMAYALFKQNHVVIVIRVTRYITK